MPQKIIYLILAIVFLLIIIGLLYLFFKPQVPPKSFQSTQKEKIEKILEEERVILKLNPQKGSYLKGEPFSVEIILESEDRGISGVDVLLSYNLEILELINQEADREGSIFSVWPMNQLENGILKFSALTQPGRLFSGQGKVATLHFRGKKEGSAQVSFLFKKGSTTDTNVAGNGQDILEEVINGIYQIK